MPIFMAISLGNANEVMRLLNTDPSLLEAAGMPWDMKGIRMTPLIHAASAGRLEIVKLLIGKGVDIHATASHAQTALHLAATHGHEEVVAYLLEHGAQTGHQDVFGDTPLMSAVRMGRPRGALLLLEHMGGQGLEASCPYGGYTALHRAVHQGCMDLVAALLNHGARADTTSRDGTSALQTAVRSGHLGVVRLLVDKLGSEALQVRDAGGRSLLHAVMQEGREELVGYLLSNGLTPSMRDNRRETALMCGARSRSIRVMWRLLGHMGGKGLDERDNDGKTALHWAVCRYQPENVRALLVAGADPTIVDNDGETPRQCTEGSIRSETAAVFKVGARRNVGSR
jgi:ankyrin repeat protein